MKNFIQYLGIAVMIIIFLSPSNVNAENIYIIENKHLSDSIPDFQNIAEEAYLYAFPMLIAYKVLLDFNVNESSSQYKGPINTLVSEARVFTPADTVAAAVNSDTPYSFAQLDLRPEPMVLYMPEMEEKRYYDVQLTDMYTDNFGYMGSRSTGNKAGYYLVAGPNWKGKKPKGIDKVFQCETDFTMVIYRTQLFGPDDMPNVEKIQNAYKLMPLSAYLKKPAPTPAPQVDWLAFKPEGFTTQFITYLNFILQFCPPTGSAEVEKPMRERFAKIGIIPGKEWDPTQFTPEQMQAISAGVKAGFGKINHKADRIGKNIDGWQIGTAQGNRDFFNGDWTLRAAAAKNGVYGNDAIEATYPIGKTDINLVPLDANKHTYSITFPKGQLPPVNAFWSITMYNSRLFLIDNPIDRYLINSPMLDQLKFNDDGSLTIFVQYESPGADKESNWLPAPDGPFVVVMRMYWPKSDPPSILPLGEGTWNPPGIQPIANLNAAKVKRTGDKSFEDVIRTDERYGGDPFFNGPRGYGYWNYLEYPMPIQNPNLWPDFNSTYFLAKFNLPAGSSLTFNGTYPQVRYMKFALYKEENGTFVSIGQDLAGFEIEPNPGSVNPFVPGNERLSNKRDFTITLKALDPPDDPSKRDVNTLYTGKDGGVLEMVLRIYFPDQGIDGAGWGISSRPETFGDLPVYTGELADGTKLSSKEVVDQFSIPFDGNTKQPVSDKQWHDVIHSKKNDPALDPATAPALETPKWEKYWTFPYSIVGSFKTPEERAKIPYAGAIDGGGDPATQYLLIWLSKKIGDVYVMRGKMPSFPNTFEGERGMGLEIMPEAQTQYFSIVSCEGPSSGKIYDGLADMQIPLDEKGFYTIVASRKEDRPNNATRENGIAWIELSPNGDGIHIPGNRKDFGMLMIRMMANDPSWKERPDNVLTPGTEEAVMGTYYPVGEYTDKATFEANGLK